MTETLNPTDDIKKRIGCDLIIKRVPKEALEQFKSFSNEKFESDYGMCLMFLLDCFQGMYPKGTEHLELRIDQLEKEVQELKEEKEKTNRKVRLDGSTRN